MKSILISSSVTLVGIGISYFVPDSAKYWVMGSAVVLGGLIWYFLKLKKKKGGDNIPKPVSVGIIGKLDSVGKNYAEAFSKNPDARLLAITDATQPKDMTPFGTAKFFGGYKEMIDSGLVDSIVITTPPNTHIGIIEYATSKKKSVLVDGPLGLSLAESQRAKKIVVEKNTHLFFGYQIIYTPAFIRVKEMLNQNCSTGDNITSFNVIYRENAKNLHNPSEWVFKKENGGGCLMDSGLSVISFLEDIFGKLNPTKVDLINDENSAVETKAEIDFTAENKPELSGHFSLDWNFSGEVVRKYKFVFSSGKKVIFNAVASTVTYEMDDDTVLFEIKPKDVSVSQLAITFQNIADDCVRLFRDKTRNFSKSATGPFVTVMECYEKGKKH